MSEPTHTNHPEPPINAQGRAYDPDVTSDEQTYAMFMHLSLLGYLIINIFAIAIPIVMWVIKKDESPFLDDHGREALNFQITLVIFSILIVPIGLVTCGAGFFLYIPLYILALIGMIFAAIAANRGEFYRYPMTIRFLK